MSKTTTLKQKQLTKLGKPQGAKNVGAPKATDWSILTRFFSYSLQYKKSLFLAICSIPVLTASAVVVPWLIVKISDEIIIHRNFQQMLFWIFFLLAAALLNMLFEFCYSFSLQYNAQKSIFKIRQELFERIIAFPKKFFDRQPLGKILSRLTSDFENVQESLAIGVLSFVTDAIKTLFLIILLYFLNFQLAIIVTLFFPVIFLVTQVIRRLMQSAYIIARSALAAAAAYLGECIQGMQTIQLYLAEEKVLKNYRNKNQTFFQQQQKINWYESLLFSFVEGISIICLLFVLWYAAALSLKDLVTISVILAFMNALQKCFIPMRELFQQVSTIQRALSSLHQIELLFLEKMEKKIVFREHKKLQNLKNICFSNVSFRYPEQKNYVLKNISFEIRAKEKIALCGATGSGKSTILRLLTKQYSDYEGSIKINGIELKRIPREVLNEFCSVLFQDVFLFNDTVEFNVGLENKSSQAIWDALQYVDAADFVSKMQGKEKFVICDNGKNISTGEGQLLSLARIVAQKKELFLLDEATSSVDTITAKKISQAIKKIFSQKTTIAIAHQLSTIRQSDKILVLENGEVVEEGSHKELLKKKGIYAGLISVEN
jgi:ATP-binding cassette subfamily B protein